MPLGPDIRGPVLREHEVDGLEETRVRYTFSASERGGGNAELLACDEQQPMWIKLALRDRDGAATLEPELIHGLDKPTEVAMELCISDLAFVIDDGDRVGLLG